MSQLAEWSESVEVPELPTELPAEDGEPLESNWHRLQINLLVDLTHQLWPDREDYFAGGNMFIYYSLRQTQARDYRGPDFFVVKDVEPRPNRRTWVVWAEDARFPDVIVELLSPSTATTDLTTKKHLYERTFRTPEYFTYDPDSRRLLGWRLSERQYRALTPDERGRLWSEELQIWLGEWEGVYEKVPAPWLRFHTRDGLLVPTGEEAARARAQQAEARLEQEAVARRGAEARAAQEAEARRLAEARAAELAAELERLRGRQD